MPRLGDADRTQTAMTPRRRTRAVFDVPETITINEGFGGIRLLSEVSPAAVKDKGRDSRFARHVYHLATGAYILRPAQLDLADFQEMANLGSPGGGIFRPEDDTPTRFKIFAIGLLTSFVFRTSISNGMAAAGAAVHDKGDPFYQKEVKGGQSWEQSVDAPARINSLPDNFRRPPTQPLDAVEYSQETQRADMPYCLRWILPGSPHIAPDHVFCFFFGQYALDIQGDGTAGLWEWARKSKTGAGNAFAWNLVDTFRYCRAAQAANVAHMLCIFPHRGPQGEKFISFISSNLDATQPGSASGHAPHGGSHARHGMTTTEYVYKWDFALTGTIEGAPDHVTSAAPFFLSVRRDLAMPHQISPLAFLTSGILVDQPWSGQPAGDGIPASSAQVTLWTTHDTTRGTVTASVADANTQSTTAIKDPFVTFTFGSADGTDTPVLWGYGLEREGIELAIAPGLFESPVVSAHTTGGESDPRQETALIAIEDKDGALTRLRTRGELSLRLQTDFLPPGADAADESAMKKVVLFRGVAQRPHRTRYGQTGRQRGGLVTNSAAAGDAETPSAQWHRFEISAGGMWLRLSERTSRTAFTLRQFANDPKVPARPDGRLTPWKVTDAIRYMLNRAGFPLSMIAIPDLGMRLWPGIGTQPSDLLIDGTTDLAALIMRLCRDYLGAFLAFDPNAGADGPDGMPIGQWILIQAPDPDAPPVWNFRSSPTITPGNDRTLKYAGLYQEPQTSYVIGPITGYTDPPESNHLWMIAHSDVLKNGGLKIENHAYNYKSYKVPGDTIDPDPNSPHYIGHERILIVADPTLWGGDGAGSHALTQAAVDYKLRRYFNYACRARQVLPFTAPLDFILDPVTLAYRPLRFYDPVTFDGEDKWYVRSVDAGVDGSDLAQTAYIEIERLVPLTE